MNLFNFFRSSLFFNDCPSSSATKLITKIAALILATGGISVGGGVVGEQAIAQTDISVNRDPATGSVEIDRNAFEIETGPLTNQSNIPLPGLLPPSTSEGVALPEFVPGQLAPNTVDIRTDFDFIQESFSNQVNQQSGDNVNVTLQRDSVQTTTEFELNYVPNEHNFGEGIEVTVFDANGNVVGTPQTRFVRGDAVTVGPNGETLPTTGNITVEYGIDERVQLRVLNIRSDNAAPTESGVYFTESGGLIAEDLPDGGDLDFDDGEYFEVEGGAGVANGIEESETIEITTRTEAVELEPEIRRDAIVESDTVSTESDTVTDVLSQEVDYGTIELPDNQTMRLGHAVGARSETGELLVYDRYSSVGQFRAGTDGIGATGQLRPLNSNPNAAPTLLTGDVVIDPFADDNEAILGASVGLTQFLTRTHRNATDVFDNPIVSPDESRLLEPTGLFNNRRLVGYVPPRLDDSAQGTIESTNGIFELPDDRGVVIQPPTAQSSVGPGNAAYTDNVGGLLIEQTDGGVIFVPQWTKEGYEQDSLTLEAGEASRIIYALVPQQVGQDLQLGEVYDVETGGGSYRIADGRFTIIAADQYPDNFFQESSEIYTVEDTLPTIENATTRVFNGIRGLYIEPDGTALVPTVDPNLPEEADARVGNLLSPLGLGQLVYPRTTRAAGFYVGGALRGGLGNQRDTTRSVVSTSNIESDVRTVVEQVSVFSTPVNQVTTTQVESTTTTQRDGIATFEIGQSGLLSQVGFEPTNEGTSVTTTRDLATLDPEVQLGVETLVSSDQETRTEVLASRIIEQDVSTVDGSDSYVNAAPVQGELALGGVLNFGNTPWTPAANTLRAELFAQETVFGRSSDDSDFGWRAELMFYPFGEVSREGFQYDEAGNLVPLYQTEPVMENGEQVVDLLTAADGTVVGVPVNQFVLDENGDRIPQKVGTGRSKGPGVYVRVEGEFDGDDDTVVNGGLQFTF
ncbi:MAG: hypothetical protein AAF703_09920 [Cyanobacteria bacterium P01_D01_bin.105]